MAKTMDILHIELDGKISTKTVSEGDEDYLITSEEECYRLISEVKAIVPVVLGIVIVLSELNEPPLVSIV